MKTALENAFIRLDEDLSREALTPVNGQLNMKTLSVAMSGTVACVAHIDGPHLHIAHVGDCCAVLGKRYPIEKSQYCGFFMLEFVRFTRN